ncbi:hypothetical protein QWY31_08545 [Cytophagales bacterium LB-30]|uniref:Membrane or secreted protein n=1 Tax=Shiella aurantiaca TaxID=3058365 RepID=A0ABT8F507_9BACT|nr:hypothetical protein [Shiella aurantiaca]MDN4165547.1 hypothetical protein [Shiella aurantiaca]
MVTILLAVGILAIFFVLLSVRLLFLKNGEFRGTCASQSPYLNKTGEACGFCGKVIGEGEACGDPDAYKTATQKA